MKLKRSFVKQNLVLLCLGLEWDWWLKCWDDNNNSNSTSRQSVSLYKNILQRQDVWAAHATFRSFKKFHHRQVFITQILEITKLFKSHVYKTPKITCVWAFIYIWWCSGDMLGKACLTCLQCVLSKLILGDVCHFPVKANTTYLAGI